MLKALIFDFDGVLVSSELARFQALQKFAKKHNVIISDDKMEKMVGRRSLTFLHEILTETEKLSLPKIIEDYETGYKGNITEYVAPIDLTVEFIRNYKGPKDIGLASMSSRKAIEMVLNHFGIYNKFKSITSVDDVTNYKPHPEVYLKAASALGVLPTECIAIEDTIVGARSALSADIPCYIVLNGFNTREEFSNLPIEGFITTQENLKKITQQ
jgi:HAD superfamily hydrolase (TIGR01509 family)